MKKGKHRAIAIIVILYIVVIIAFSLGKKLAENAGLEYRYWVEFLFYMIAWFVPVIIAGGLINMTRRWSIAKGMSIKTIMTIVLIAYCIMVGMISLGYPFLLAMSMTTDEKMPDGNLVVSVPEGMEYSHYYAEPVAVIFRRQIIFDNQRMAESLSKIYDVNFQAEDVENGETVFISDVYSGLEVRIIRHGYSESNYLDNTLSYMLTSQKLEEHSEIFDKNNVTLMPYVFGKTKEKPEGYGTLYAVVVTGKNQEDVAIAIAEFIRTTLQEDTRADGKSCWFNIDGSIFLVSSDEESGEMESFRNIPFSLNPSYSWIYDEMVTSDEVREKIALALE